MLPTEVIERILMLCGDPRNVAAFARTSRLAHRLVYEADDQYLWRELYFGRPFDDLRRAAPVPKERRALLPPDAEPACLRLLWPYLRAPHIPWKTELQRRTQAELIAASGTTDAAVLQLVYEAFVAAIETASPATAPTENLPSTAPRQGQHPPGLAAGDRLPRSENLRWLDRIVRKTRILDVAPIWTVLEPEPETPPPEDPLPRSCHPLLDEDEDADDPGSFPEHEEDDARGKRPVRMRERVVDGTDLRFVPEREQRAFQLRCRLRAALALSHESSFDADARARMAALRRVSRAFVYDMRRYQPRTLWGPYRVWDADGRTVLADWEHVEHIVNVVGLKLREIQLASLGFYKRPLFSVEALRAYSAVSAHSCPEGDWAGVTGKWRRFVCFMDYRQLAHQYSLLPPGPHDPSFFDEPFDEALRPVELNLALISKDEYFSKTREVPVDPSRAGPEHPTGPIADAEDPAFPTLYFAGQSHGVASVRGKVSTLADGAIRWQFVTSYDGRMQWSAEGIQLGNVCSAAGVAGIWTGAFHDREDPAGPFWMSKVGDDLPTGILNSLH
ncbi:uncharacterized protein BXZ73DRAFT_48780 [Epithele typhae]|uniref:uncharacterized protein n=1 Tax=Epithele typhae TaxID=378194 RepID=UPI0020086343|nr:uncharacterized protein BXZ73DRAFT_48780 [Epithele typhae]KAH9927518.1 hypothetical protein BXZ73DRAFT_48780 [Epithele typhae]